VTVAQGRRSVPATVAGRTSRGTRSGFASTSPGRRRAGRLGHDHLQVHPGIGDHAQHVEDAPEGIAVAVGGRVISARPSLPASPPPVARGDEQLVSTRRSKGTTWPPNLPSSRSPDQALLGALEDADDAAFRTLRGHRSNAPPPGRPCRLLDVRRRRDVRLAVCGSRGSRSKPAGCRLSRPPRGSCGKAGRCGCPGS